MIKDLCVYGQLEIHIEHPFHPDTVIIRHLGTRLPLQLPRNLVEKVYFDGNVVYSAAQHEVSFSNRDERNYKIELKPGEATENLISELICKGYIR